MSITLTVDLATASARDIARAAKFMLVFAGFQDPNDVPVVFTGVDPTSAFAAGVGGNLNAQADLPLHPSIASELSGAEASQHNVPVNLDVGAALRDPSAFQQAAPQAVGAKTTAELLTDANHGGWLGATNPQSQAIAPPPGIEVDSQGVPWDPRIHAGSRAKIADGSWRQKRNLDPALYKTVMDELRHTMGVERRAPQPPAPPVPPQAFAPVPPIPPIPATPPIDAEVVWPVQQVVPPAAPFAASVAPPAPPISPIPTVPASAGAATVASPGNVAAPIPTQPPAPPAGPAPTFPQLMQKITAAFHAKQLTQADIQNAVQSVGLTALPMLASRPDLVGGVATALGLAL